MTAFFSAHFSPIRKQPFTQTAKPKPKPLAKRATNESQHFLLRLCFIHISNCYAKHKFLFSHLTFWQKSSSPKKCTYVLEHAMPNLEKKNLPQTAVTIGRFTTHNLAHFFPFTAPTALSSRLSFHSISLFLFDLPVNIWIRWVTITHRLFPGSNDCFVVHPNNKTQQVRHCGVLDSARK